MRVIINFVEELELLEVGCHRTLGLTHQSKKRKLAFILHFYLIFFQNCLLLCCDWQLSARRAVWQREVAPQTVTHQFLSNYQKDLNSLRKVADGVQVSLPTSRPQICCSGVG